MNEDQIERIYEREMDRLDEDFVSGKMTRQEYDIECKDLNHWVTEAYHSLRNPNCRY